MGKNFLNIVRIIVFGLAAMVLAVGCGTKKNTALSRNWQAFSTRYNVYFNGNEHFKETLKTMEDGYQDDFTRMLLTHPADARADESMPKPTGDFKRTIEKMQKAIQLHSIKKKPAKRSSSPKDKAFRARDEFNPFLHNAWLMLGKGQYFNGDFMGAAATFMYISRHFVWLPEVVTEALLWQARCYAALDWTYEAENILVKIKKDKDLTNGTLRNLYDIVEASYLIKAGRYAEAIPMLRSAADKSSGVQKHRLYFLLGQACRQEGKDDEAYQAFKKAASGFSTPYRLKFNARIKQSEVFRGKDISKEVASLKSMARYQRNNEFLDQIYYAIGNLYLSRQDTTHAQEYYALAVEKSTRDGVDKAMANLALGRIYFDQKHYTRAQVCYSSAVPQLPKTYPDYKEISLRSDVLDQLAVYAGNVELQDSLLAIAALPEDKQKEWADEQVETLLKKEKEEAEAAAREEAMANRPQGNSPIDQMGANTGMQFNTDKSWYFYNNATKQSGKTEFQRRWGSRKLEDDWRRRNKTSFAFEDETTSAEGDENEEGGSQEGESGKEKGDKEVDPVADPHYPEYYLAQLPATDEQKAIANDVIQEGMYNIGIILKDKLEDFAAAKSEFDELLEKYPDNVYRLDVYYNMYLMAARRDDVQGMEKWRQRIMADFPDSPYGKAMADPQYFDRLKRMHEVEQTLYSEAYADYLADNNAEVHRIMQEMEGEYPLSAIMPKFVFIDALSYLTEGDYGKFKERLEELLRKWPDTDMTDFAGAVLKGLNEGRVPHAGSSNTRGMIWDTRLTSSGAEIGENGEPANFEMDPDSPQYLVLAYPRDEINGNQLLFDVARFNFSSFVVKDFDLEPMSFDNVGLIVIKGFSNMRELENYRRVMTNRDFQLPEGVRPIMISKYNFELLLKEGRSFEEYFRFEEGALTEEAVDAALEGVPADLKDDAKETLLDHLDENQEVSEESSSEEVSEESPEEVSEESPEVSSPTN